MFWEEEDCECGGFVMLMAVKLSESVEGSMPKNGRGGASQETSIRRTRVPVELKQITSPL